MQYSKKISDTFGDDVEVSVGVQTSSATVLLEFAEDGTTQMLYTPAKARALAKALKQAANVAEGKPSVIIDGDGDDWHLGPNGKYDLYGTTLDQAAASRSYIRREYGISEERP